MSDKIRWISERLNRRTMTVITASLTLVVGFGVFEGTKDTVTLSIDHNNKVIRTHAKTVNQVLAAEGYNAESVRVSPQKGAKVSEGMKISVTTEKNITLTMDGKVVKKQTTAKTVGEFLTENSIDVSEHDYVSPSTDLKVEDGLNILVNRSFPVTLQLKGNKMTVQTVSTTVGDFLKAQNIALKDSDLVEPALQETIQKDFIIKIVNVQKVTDVVEESLEPVVIKKNDSNLLKGKTRVVQEGKEGKVRKTYEVVKEDGKIKSKKLVNKETIFDALPHIIAVGLKVPSRGPAETGKEFLVEATAYSPYCNGCSGHTALGYDVRENPTMKLIAVDPRVIPLGSRVYVEGYGYAIAADTGGAIKGNRIDLLMPSEASAYRWGRKIVKIRIIK